MPEPFNKLYMRNEKIAVLTGYDEKDAGLLESCGIDAILVGDSVGNVRLGYPDTKSVSIQDMVCAVEKVAGTVKKTHVIGDMPYKTYETSADALENADKIIEAGADSVKLEGGKSVREVIRAIVDSGIPVMGHIGHTPQTESRHVRHGKSIDEVEKLVEDALSIQASGGYSTVIELCEEHAAGRITGSVGIPTIGIGAGPYVSGQVLVLDDLLDWTDFRQFPKGKPGFIGQWMGTPEDRVRGYVGKVKEESFPSRSG